MQEKLDLSPPFTATLAELHSSDHEDEHQNSINDEYNSALHTKSFMELCSTIAPETVSRSSSSITASRTNKTTEDDKDKQALQTLPHSISYTNHIPRILDSLHASTSSSSSLYSSKHLHTQVNLLLLDFFNTTQTSTVACASLLSSITLARVHHFSIRKLLLNLISSTSNSTGTFYELSTFLENENPLSDSNLSHFHLVHSSYSSLIRNLNSVHQRVSRRLKWLFIGWVRTKRQKSRIDAATKGAYIVERDLDTMSQILRRVHDEIEHGREIARMVVRNREWEMVKEVVKEMEGKRREVGLGFDEELKELEEHVYLCLVTIRRSRWLVAKQLEEHDHDP